jgi:phage terminase large subunit GpA-like protein
MGARDDVLADADEIIGSIWREYLAPVDAVTVTEWSEQKRILSSKDSAEPGPYRVARTPYAREPMDCLSAGSRVEDVVLMWGAQTSKTTIGSNWLGYLADVNPGPVMIVQPTIDLGKRYSRQRLTPMITESPALRAKVSENRSRGDSNTTLLKEFPGGVMVIAGANSAAGLRSMPVRDLFLDEIDGYPLDVDGEGDPCKLAEARQTTFSRRKRLKTSTPTTKEFSRIERRIQRQRSLPVSCRVSALRRDAVAAVGRRQDLRPQVEQGRRRPAAARQRALRLPAQRLRDPRA